MHSSGIEGSGGAASPASYRGATTRAARHRAEHGDGIPKASRLECCNWALEYHTLILFWDLVLKGDHYEIKVYTFFSLQAKGSLPASAFCVVETMEMAA